MDNNPIMKMSKGCWKFDEDDRALYIDIEENTEEEKENKIYSCWDQTPDILLEEIFFLFNYS